MSEGQTAAPPPPNQWALQQRAASPAPSSSGSGNNAIDNPFAAISNAAMQTVFGEMGNAGSQALAMQVNIFSKFFGKEAGG